MEIHVTQADITYAEGEIVPLLRLRLLMMWPVICCLVTQSRGSSHEGMWTDSDCFAGEFWSGARKLD